MMSNCQKNTVKKGAGWIAFITYIIVVAAVLGAIFGVKLWDFQIAFFASSAGSFFTYAVFIAVFS